MLGSAQCISAFFLIGFFGRILACQSYLLIMIAFVGLFFDYYHYYYLYLVFFSDQLC